MRLMAPRRRDPASAESGLSVVRCSFFVVDVEAGVVEVLAGGAGKLPEIGTRWSLPTYVTVPLERTMTLASFVHIFGCPRACPELVEGLASETWADCRGSTSPHDVTAFVLTLSPQDRGRHVRASGCVQHRPTKCRLRISDSRGRKSYSISSRSMVSRWRRRTAVEIRSANLRVSLPPDSKRGGACRGAVACGGQVQPRRRCGIVRTGARIPLANPRVEVQQ